MTSRATRAPSEKPEDGRPALLPWSAALSALSRPECDRQGRRRPARTVGGHPRGADPCRSCMNIAGVPTRVASAHAEQAARQASRRRADERRGWTPSAASMMPVAAQDIRPCRIRARTGTAVGDHVFSGQASAQEVRLWGTIPGKLQCIRPALISLKSRSAGGGRPAGRNVAGHDGAPVTVMGRPAAGRYPR